ncbi:MAG: MATE family efflux transporter [Candidatus Bathyarchaeia archaeon]
MKFRVLYRLKPSSCAALGYNHGAQKEERVREIVIKAMLISVVWGALWYMMVMLFPTQTLLLFTTDPGFISIGKFALQIFAITFLTMSEVIIRLFQGIGEVTSALIIASARQVIFLIPCLLILPYTLGLNGLWLAYL